MIRYPSPDLNTLPEDIKAQVLEVQEKAGFVPNVFLALARRPAEWRAFFAYHDALMLKEEGSNPNGTLTKGEREMIVTTTSAANNCLYCVVAHGARAWSTAGSTGPRRASPTPKKEARSPSTSSR